MKNARAWKVVVTAIVLSLAAACGGPGSTLVDEESELRSGHGLSPSECCRRVYPPGRHRGHCIAEATRGRGICAHPGKHDAGACDAGRGGAGGLGGGGGAGGQAGGGAGNADAGDAGEPDGAGGVAGGGGGAPACTQPSPGYVWNVPAAGTPSIIQAIDGTIWGISGSALERWDGATWAVISESLPVGSTNGILRGSSANDVWISAGNASIYRWNGGAFVDVSPSTLVGVVVEMSVLGPQDTWIVGTQNQQPSVNHWNGTTWTEIPLPSDMPPVLELRHVWATSPNDVWITASGRAVESSRDLGVILHWDGSAMRRPSTRPFASDQARLNGIWASSAADVWVTGESTGGIGLSHYDGTNWTEVGSDSNESASFNVWGDCPTNVWATSYAGVRHFDGTTWSLVTPLTAYGPISGTGPDDVWISGSAPFLPISSSLRWQKDFCGNGTVGPDETCEPPGRVAVGSTPACDSTCHVPTCGNLVVDPGETCDPPNGNTCDDRCQDIPIVCGDGRIQPGEACDPPDGVRCNSQCQTIPTCAECTIGQERCDFLTGGPVFCIAGLDGCGHWGPSAPRNGCIGRVPPAGGFMCSESGGPYICYFDAAGCRVEGTCPTGQICVHPTFSSVPASCIPSP